MRKNNFYILMLRRNTSKYLSLNEVFKTVVEIISKDFPFEIKHTLKNKLCLLSKHTVTMLCACCQDF